MMASILDENTIKLMLFMDFGKLTVMKRMIFT